VALAEVGSLGCRFLLLLANVTALALLTEGATHPFRKWHAKDEVLAVQRIEQATGATAAPAQFERRVLAWFHR
jgi:hypothetical protein